MRLICLSLLLTTISLGCDRTTTPQKDAPVATGTVTIIVETGTEVIERTVDNVTQGTTVLQVMQPLKDLSLEVSGSGATALVTSLKGLGNSGSEGWTYRVDQQFGDRSIGIYELSPPATITWKYGDFSEMNE